MFIYIKRLMKLVNNFKGSFSNLSLILIGHLFIFGLV